MDILFQFTLLLIAGYACLLMAILIVENIAALTYRPQLFSSHDMPMPDTVVLIPAHNEEQGIAETLTSLQKDLPENCRILCVAHNCSDGTAQVAAASGAEAIEVNDDGTGGKPDALKAGLRWLDKQSPEVVVIIDADCTVTKNTLRRLAWEAKKYCCPVMGSYFFAPADSSQQISKISSLALTLKNFIRPLGLQQLGLPCLLNGSGSAYPFEIIRNVPHGEGSIAEDYQLTVDLLKQGYPTRFIAEARTDGHLPLREATAQKQRRRWEHGHLLLSFRTAPRLLVNGIMRFNVQQIALGLELLVPPLAYLGLISGGAIIMALIAAVWIDPTILFLLIGTAIILVVSLMLSSVRFCGSQTTMQAILAVPQYIFWKLPIYRDFFQNRETRWMKTERD